MGLPPPAGSKKLIPSKRSNKVIWKAKPINCVAVNAMIEVASTLQARMGMLNIAMPGVRMRKMVAIRLSAPRMDDQPTNHTPTKNNWMPIGPRMLSGA